VRPAFRSPIPRSGGHAEARLERGHPELQRVHPTALLSMVEVVTQPRHLVLQAGDALGVRANDLFQRGDALV